MKRSRINPISKRRAALNRLRARVVAGMAKDGRPACVRCGKPADDAHELLSRARGGSVIDPANIVPLDRECHDWVTTHPKEATELGLLVSAYGGRE